MAKRGPAKPTDSELAILRVLWQRGPSTVREVREQLGTDREIGYTTVLKFCQIMTEKGLVSRDDSKRSHVYQAAMPRERTQRQIVKDVLDKAFGGSAAGLVAQALSAGKTSAEELDEIRKLLDELGRGPK